MAYVGAPVKPDLKRALLALVAGLAAWVLVATLLDVALRLALPGYAAGEPTMTFTRGMLIARLTLAVITSLAAGATTALIAPRSAWVPWTLGVLLLVIFVPEHLKLWHVFPAWYHLSFLVTLVPLILIGWRLWLLRAGARHSEGR
jgi:hypothetical protein